MWILFGEKLKANIFIFISFVDVLCVYRNGGKKRIFLVHPQKGKGITKDTFSTMQTTEALDSFYETYIIHLSC